MTLSLLLLSACGPNERGIAEEEPGPGGPTQPGGPAGPGGNPDDRGPCAKMDIVFVVDNSGSMAEEQANLAANFPRFIDVLNSFKTGNGKPLDYRVAVTTTGRDLSYKIVVPLVNIEIPMNEKGENGLFLLRQDCGMSRRWLERDEPGGVSKVFSCAARVGTGGPSIEMPLYTLNLSLRERVADGTNAGFLRDDALLAAVILSDEDDCSREDNNFTVPNDSCDNNIPQIQPVSRYISFLDHLKRDRGRWAAAVIAGPTNCKSQFGEAADAKRLREFVDKTGKNGVFSSICEGDLTKALNDALRTFNAACESFPPLG